ncbi:MAG: hypothetical protein WC997_12805 [Porticoccaceae bacterium]
MWHVARSMAGGEGFQQRRRQDVAVAASMDGLAAVLEALSARHAHHPNLKAVSSFLTRDE